MIRRLPRGLIVLLSCVGTISLCSSIYLEFYHLDVLSRHPVSANLLSSVIGFSFGLLAVSVGFNWLTERARLDGMRTIRTTVSRLCAEMEDVHRDADLAFVIDRGYAARPDGYRSPSLGDILLRTEECRNGALSVVDRVVGAGIELPSAVEAATGHLRGLRDAFNQTLSDRSGYSIVDARSYTETTLKVLRMLQQTLD